MLVTSLDLMALLPKKQETSHSECIQRPWPHTMQVDEPGEVPAIDAKVVVIGNTGTV